MEKEIPYAKRPRLSMACNTCRQRKVRCDTDTPKCRNCRLRNDECTTTDPRMPHVTVIREWIAQPDIIPKASGPSLGDAGQSQPHVTPQSPAPISMRPETGSLPNSTAGSAPWRQDAGISPAQQPYEAAFHRDDRTDRIKMVGGSSAQCLMKSLDVYLEAAQVQPLSHEFRHGMRHIEEMEIPLTTSLPTLPESRVCNTYVSVFFEKIHTLYPLFDIDSTKKTVQKFASLSEFFSLSHEQVPLLVSTYLILSLGADEDAEGITNDGTKYLKAAASLLGHVILEPYLNAIQTLLLFTLAYRGRNKDGIGWQTLGMAIRIAHSIGLHRHSTKRPLNQHGVQKRYDQLFHARIWAICCSLEKMMQLESGRPAIIQVVDRDHMMGPDQHSPGHDFLQWHMGLAQLQGLICHHIYGHKPGDRTAKQILSDTARLDRSLLSWAAEIPEEFRPGNDLFCPDQEFHIAAFLSVQYYQAMITLHRAALIAPSSTFSSEVAKHVFEDSSKFRLTAGEAICVSSARSIARLAIELPDRKAQSRILTACPPLLACIVLGISLVKNPGIRMRAADLELLKACVECTKDQYFKSGHNTLFVKAVTSIYQQVRSYVNRNFDEQIPKLTTSRISTERDFGHYAPEQLQPQGSTSDLEHQNPNVVGQIDGRLKSGSAIIEEFGNSEPRSQFRNHFNGPQHNTLTETETATSLTNPAQYAHSVTLPFDNFNVQELWAWMGELEGYDNYSYWGSHEGN